MIGDLEPRTEPKEHPEAPLCDYCGEPIDPNEYYDFFGDIICTECIYDYLKDFKVIKT